MEPIDPRRAEAAEARLYDLLGPELNDIVEAVKDRSFLIQIPESYDVDKALEELASLVARTANRYGQAARFSGMAAAEAKLAKGRLDRKWKRSRQGRNEGEREETAMAACLDEHTALSVAEAVAKLAEGMESAARVASESARKLHASAENQLMAERRGAHGSLREQDFGRPY